MFFGENEGIKKSGKSIKGNPTFKMFYRTLMIAEFNFCIVVTNNGLLLSKN
jgi:hypothetical protein